MSMKPIKTLGSLVVTDGDPAAFLQSVEAAIDKVAQGADRHVYGVAGLPVTCSPGRVCEKGIVRLFEGDEQIAIGDFSRRQFGRVGRPNVERIPSGVAVVT